MPSQFILLQTKKEGKTVTFLLQVCLVLLPCILGRASFTLHFFLALLAVHLLLCTFCLALLAVHLLLCTFFLALLAVWCYGYACIN